MSIELVQKYRQEVQKITKDKDVFLSLAQHTFKGFHTDNIPKALLKAQLMGFTIHDFLIGNIYAVQFQNKNGGYDFSIISSIDNARKIAMKSGQTGKSKPQFVFDEKNNIVSCAITVYKKEGHEDGYTAEVFFKEYNTGRNLWKSKPITMIAKVAEMHALRMAFPEELANHYIGEEKSDVIDLTPEDTNEENKEKYVISQEDIDKTIIKIEEYTSLKELVDFYKSLEQKIIQNEQVAKAFVNQKHKCQNKTTK